jgi:hypothetical protein
MKQTAPPTKLSHLDENRSRMLYDGKTVEFLYDLGGKLLLLTGRFMVRLANQLHQIEIQYTGRLHPHDPPCSDYRFQVSEPHLRSTVAATKPGSPVEFVIETPLRSDECARLETWDSAAAVSLK